MLCYRIQDLQLQLKVAASQTRAHVAVDAQQEIGTLANQVDQVLECCLVDLFPQSYNVMQLKQDNTALQQELATFDAEFFEEIEDLKVSLILVFLPTLTNDS
jgi:acetolactate synthase regulatory subunit